MAHRVYHIPIVVSGEDRPGTAALAVHTTKGAKRRTRHRWRQAPGGRMRSLVTSLGGIGLPLLMRTWARGLLPLPETPNPQLIAAIAIGVTLLNTWLLAATRLMREPDRLPGSGVV